MADAYLMSLDFGLAKIGVAVGSMAPSQPLTVIRYQTLAELLARLEHLVRQESPAGMVIGWPADHLTISTPQTEKVRQFGDMVAERLSLPIIYFPETLTTQEATQRMVAAGIAKQRRRQLEDAYAAAAILDSYLESIT